MGQAYDAIVIGSGMGGLAAASLLSRLENRRVLVLEKHFKPGGFTHGFSRPGGYRWDVGVHYVGDMDRGSLMHRIFSLVTDGAIRWSRMPDPFERFVYPDAAIPVRASGERYLADLIQAFPKEERALRAYFQDIRGIYSGWLRHETLEAVFPRWVDRVAGGGRWTRHARKTTGEYLAERFQDARLRAILASQWLDYGLPPAESAFVLHSTIATHYLEGGYYPEGGAGRIADAVEAVVNRAGGELKLCAAVTRVLVRDGRAVGVQVREGTGSRARETEYFADQIISNVGAYGTYDRLLADVPEAEPHRAELRNLRPSAAHVNLFVGFRDDPAKLGFRGENHWLFTGYDHDALYARRNRLLDGEASCAFLSFPSLRDPAATRGTAEIIALVDHDRFAEWADGRWRRRGEDYDALKARISGALLDLIERHYPGFKAMVSFQELSTPLTTEHFTGHRGGCIYGVPFRPERFDLKAIGLETPVRNLSMVGADALASGLVGAMMTGVLAAARLMGGSLGLGRIMMAARRFRPAEPAPPVVPLARAGAPEAGSPRDGEAPRQSSG